ncbi:MAG TPA: amino acid adenylation domain-containing protein, partial [Pseudomonadales bacterium]|nr:amino acid adenylation domain-containing protein [Pseudomonadales bacterium]
IAPQSRTRFMYNFYHFLPTIQLNGEVIESRAHIPEMSGPVQLVIAQIGNGLNFNLKFTPGLFEDRSFLDRFMLVAKQIMAGCETHQELTLLLPDEKQRSLVEWNQSEQALPPYRTVVEWIEAQVSKTPQAIAVKQGLVSLTYADLNNQANQLAHHLIKIGAKVNSRIGICLDRSIEMMVAVLAVLKAGAAYVPMDTQYPEARLQHILEDAEVPVLITQRCVASRFNEYNGHQIIMDGPEKPWCSELISNLSLQADSNDMIYVIYTSGSTGLPKGAAVKHSGEINLLNWYCKDFALGNSDKTLIISAFGFDLTQKNLFAVLTQGGTVVLPECQEYDPDAIIKTIQQEQITLINCAPSAFYPLVESHAHFAALTSLRYLFLGGEPIRIDALKAWLADANCRCQLVNSYGPTECTDVVSYYRVDPRIEENLPIGFPIHNTQLYVLDEALRPVPPGLIGEVCVTGAGVGLGYLKRDELNAEKFVSNPFGGGRLYRTGDLGRYRADGAIEYIGRKDFQVKIRGLRIELGEIEYALKQVQGVRDSLVLVNDQRLIAYVLSDAYYSEADWRPVLAKHVPDYMVPNVLITVKAWPLTPNGKIDRKALPQPDAATQREYVAPRDNIEQRLADIWADVIGVAKVGIFDNFFEIGGNSLIAARAIAKLRQEFEIEIPLRALFEMHTIADIAAYISASQWAMQSINQPASSDENRDEGFI